MSLSIVYRKLKLVRYMILVSSIAGLTALLMSGCASAPQVVSKCAQLPQLPPQLSKPVPANHLEQVESFLKSY